MNNYLAYWGLRQPPFDNAVCENLFFDEGQYAEVMDRMLYVIRDGYLGFGLITGEIGCGKSTILSVLRRRLQRDWRFQPVFIETPFGNWEEMLREILRQLDRPGGPRPKVPRAPLLQKLERYELICRFREAVEMKLARLRRRLVLLLDEAQGCSDAVLRELKTLSLLCEADETPLGLVLCGLPDLASRVAALPEIEQRIGLRCHLRPLTPAECEGYVERRLRAAGYEGPALFSADSLAALHAESGGVPRLINRIARIAMDWAFTLGERAIAADLIRRVAEDGLRQEAHMLRGTTAAW
ncbi:MAG: AAA family ATPase [Planctomycetota bacterium]|nr:AAA family ATPase [Planctomycetota bacterium]